MGSNLCLTVAKVAKLEIGLVIQFVKAGQGNNYHENLNC